MSDDEARKQIVINRAHLDQIGSELKRTLLTDLDAADRFIDKINAVIADPYSLMQITKADMLLVFRLARWSCGILAAERMESLLDEETSQ